MKIAFICSGLESGRDGVGDYSRRLAGQLIRQHHPSVAIALNDPYVISVISETQEIEGASVSVLRLPINLPWRRRIAESRHWLEVFDPDWISLQFVPFGFHRKGLCFGLGKRLRQLNTRALWHIMFHELWLGLGEKPSIKHRLWGAMQRSLIMNLTVCLRPWVVHTQAEAHRITLKRNNIEASLLSLFGNIPYADGDGWREILEPLLAKATGRHQERSKLYLAGVLGRIPPEWSLEGAVDTIFPLTQRFQSRLTLVFFGKDHLTPLARRNLVRATGNRADIIFSGERTDFEMSAILQMLDLGIATTPRQIIQKSGSVAAMLEHGLPILVTRDDWRLSGPASAAEGESPSLLSPKQFAALQTLPLRKLQPRPDNSVKAVAAQMLAALESSLGRSTNAMPIKEMLPI
ncbi:MAG: hypothetical protein ABSA83_04515 [Verrucomicrobiota bacterium]|jgi:hypothetical protein